MACIIPLVAACLLSVPISSASALRRETLKALGPRYVDPAFRAGEVALVRARQRRPLLCGSAGRQGGHKRVEGVVGRDEPLPDIRDKVEVQPRAAVAFDAGEDLQPAFSAAGRAAAVRAL